MTAEVREPEEVPIDAVRPHPRNYLRHPDEQLAHLAESLLEHGQYKNIVVARDGTILAGHGVYAAARLVGLDRLSVVRIDVDPDDRRALKILAGDNEIGRLAERDDRLLTETLRELAEAGDLLGTGFDETALAALVYVTRPETEIPTIDHAAEWAGVPEFEPFERPYRVVVNLETPEERDSFLATIGVEVVNRKDRETWSVRWPPRPKEDLSSLFFDAEERTSS